MPAHALAAARDRSLSEWRGSSASAPLRAAATLPVAATVRRCGDQSRSGVVAIAAALLGVSEPAMTGPGPGRKEVAEARQALMFALHEGLNLSYSDIGRRLHRDHATVMHGVARSAERAAASPVIRQQLDALVVAVCAVGEGLRVDSLCDIEPRIAVGAVEPEVRAARRRRRDASDENSVLAQAALRLVAEDYGLLVADLSGPSRGPVVVEARQAAMYVLHRAAAFSYPGIGRALGGRDQTTARHGVARAGDRARRSEGARRRLDPSLQSGPAGRFVCRRSGLSCSPQAVRGTCCRVAGPWHGASTDPRSARGGTYAHAQEAHRTRAGRGPTSRAPAGTAARSDHEQGSAGGGDRSRPVERRDSTKASSGSSG